MKKVFKLFLALGLFVGLFAVLSLLMLSFGNPVYLMTVPLILIFYMTISWGAWHHLDEEDLMSATSSGIISVQYKIKQRLGIVLFFPGYFMVRTIRELI